MKDIIFLGLFILLILFAIIEIIFHRKLILILKNNHNEGWRSLGSPTLIFNNSISNYLSLMAFLKNKDYLNYNDQKLNKTANFLREFMKIYFIIFLVVFVSFLILIKRSSGGRVGLR